MSNTAFTPTPRPVAPPWRALRRSLRRRAAHPSGRAQSRHPRPAVRSKATGTRAGSIPLDDLGRESAQVKPASMISAATAARTALRAVPGSLGPVELTSESGCLVWSVEIERKAVLPIVVLIDAANGEVSRVESSGPNRAPR